MAETEKNLPALSESEQHCRALFDLANDGFLVLSADGYVCDINRTGHERLGYTREEMLGMHISQLDPPEFADRVPQRIAALKQHGQLVFESAHVRKDGSAMSVEVNSRLIELGGEACMFSVVRDITERKKMERELKLTQFMTDHASIGITWVDSAGRYCYVNDQECQSLGYTRDELMGMSVPDIDPWYPMEKWDEHWQHLRETRVLNFETRHRRKDGTIFPVEVTVNYLEFDHQGYNIGFVRDITERKRVQREVQLAHAAINMSRTPFFWVNPAGQFVSVNAAACQSLGYAEEELVGKYIWDIDPDFPPAAQAKSWEQTRKNGVRIFESRHRRKDGSIFPVEVTANYATFEGEEHSFVFVQDISERQQAAQQIASLAYYDMLTGLPNRRMLFNQMRHLLAASARSQRYGALLFIDLDHFKTINDTVGHEQGDLLLVEVAKRLRDIVREEDIIARLGGDEFVVVLEEVDADREKAAAYAKVVGDKVLEALNLPYSLKGSECISSASIGVALFHGHDDDIEELLKRSDMAMYEAKRVGRNTVRFFDPAMQASLEHRIRTEADLRQALVQNQFQLYYQSRVNQLGQVVGAEALLRWLHPQRGMVAPGEFIPLCEETGLILPLGDWVLETACAQLSIWATQPATRSLNLSVNISARQFRQDNFVGQVCSILARTEVDPARLELEITESMLLDNIEQSIMKMQQLLEIGVLFSLDDFGTGYSSLSYLKRLPLSKVKIDRSFVRDITFDKNDEIIAQTIIKMGQTMGLGVVAEGVETSAQRDLLQLHGCHDFQGFLFGRPVPIAEFERALGG